MCVLGVIGIESEPSLYLFLGIKRLFVPPREVSPESFSAVQKKLQLTEEICRLGKNPCFV